MEQTDKTKEFIHKALLVHGDKYDYSKVDYKKAIEKIIIICKKVEHGVFLQQPNSHLGGCGCPFCSKTYKSDNQDFLKKAIEMHGDKYDYSKVEYKKAKEKVIIICKKHGEFEQVASCHITGDGCKECGIDTRSEKRTCNTEEFIKKAILMHSEKYDYSKVEYKKANEKVIIICKTHGEFEQTPNKHLRPSGCNKCAIYIRSNKITYNTTDFIQKSIEKHGDKYDYSMVEYNKSNEKVIIICKIHGEFEQYANIHLRGNGCQKCGKHYRYDTVEFIEKSKLIHGDKYDYSKTDYINNQTKVIITCNKHGDFEQKPNNHLNRNGCPLCKHKTEAKLYENIKQVYPSVITQFKKEWCVKISYLPFDFCIPEHKIIIELDGPQHFRQIMNWLSSEEQFENDKYKEKCANDNGYSVIRLLQEDVLNDTYDWCKELCDAIEEIKNGDEIVNIYLCKNGEYDMF